MTIRDSRDCLLCSRRGHKVLYKTGTIQTNDIEMDGALPLYTCLPITISLFLIIPNSLVVNIETRDVSEFVIIQFIIISEHRHAIPFNNPEFVFGHLVFIYIKVENDTVSDSTYYLILINQVVR